MLVVVSEQCGCEPHQNHNHSNCKLYQAQKRLKAAMDKYITDFRKAVINDKS